MMSSGRSVSPTNMADLPALFDQSQQNQLCVLPNNSTLAFLTPIQNYMASGSSNQQISNRFQVVLYDRMNGALYELSNPFTAPQLESNGSGNADPTTDTHPSPPLLTPPLHQQKSGRRGRYRPEILVILQEHYSQRQYLTPGMVNTICQHTGLTNAQVKNWFRARRQKQRKIEREDQMLGAPSNSTLPLVTVKQFGPAATFILKGLYEKQRYLTGKDLEVVAREVGLTEKQVSQWFKKRRGNEASKKKSPEPLENIRRTSREKHLDEERAVVLENYFAEEQRPFWKYERESSSNWRRECHETVHDSTKQGEWPR